MSGFFDALIANETASGIRAKVIGFAHGAGLVITDWIVGAVGQQMFEAFINATFATTSTFAQAVRGFASLDTATDPGDADSFDPNNAGLAAAPGFLSAQGANVFGTPRDGATFASGFVTFVNAGAVARTFAPGGLVFTYTVGSPPSPAPTYRNAPAPAIYTNPDGTVTVPAGATLAKLPIAAEIIGTGSNAPPSSLSLTTTLTGCSATNPTSVLGTDIEDADAYRVRCRRAPARISLGAPSAAYAYFANTNLDGSPLFNEDGAEVEIDGRTYVSQDSTTGIVTTFYATASGGASPEDVIAANENIAIQSFAVPGAITFFGASATPVAIHVAGTARVRTRPGVTAALAQAAIVKALATAFAALPIGGDDQTAGAGVIYTSDFLGVAQAAYPGLYDVVISTPSGGTTALALGHVATLTSDPATDWTVVLT